MSYVGVLALQGAFHKHLAVFEGMGVDARPFKEPEELGQLSGLVIPGGESTTIGMLLERRGLVEPLRHAIAAGLPVFGTCAGAILLAVEIESSAQIRLGVMEIAIRRNAYGSQIDSFETALFFEDPVCGIRETVEGVFIRAPLIEATGPSVRILARFDGRAVLVRQDNMLAASFHPELTASRTVHRYFVENMVGVSVPTR